MTAIALSTGPWRERLRAGTDWWVQELGGLLPWQRGAAASRPRADILLNPTEIVIERLDGGVGERWAKASAIEALDDDSWAQLAELVDGLDLRLWLTTPDVYATTLQLPLAARRRLDAAVALRVADLSPLPLERAHWAADVVDQSSDGLTVRVTFAHRLRVETIQALCAERLGRHPAIHARLANGEVRLTAAADRRPLAPGWIAAGIACALLASIPFSTWAGARLLTAFNDHSLARLEGETAPLIRAANAARNAESLRTAVAGLVQPMPITTLVEDLATHLPATAFVQSIERGADGTLTVVVDAQDPDLVRPALASHPLFKSLRETDQRQTGDGRLRITLVGGERP